MDEKEEIKDKSNQASSENEDTQEVENHVVQRTYESNITQISGDRSYQEAADYAKQITRKRSVQKAGRKSEQKAGDYAVQISDSDSSQEAGSYAVQITAHNSSQFAKDFAIQYGEFSVHQSANEMSFQIGGDNSQQYAGTYSIQRGGNDSFQSAWSGSVSIVYGRRVRCRHYGSVLQVLVFYDSWDNEIVFLTKLISDLEKHLLEAVKENGKWVLKDTIVE